VLRAPLTPGEPAILAVRPLPAAARDALPSFGLRAMAPPPSDGAEACVLGLEWALDAAAAREGPARGAAEVMRAALANARVDRFAVGGRRPFELNEPAIMAVVNATPDSFSDGKADLNRFKASLAGGRAMAEGARIVDIGGESSRPGAADVAADEEIARAIPFVEQIVRLRPDALVSIDTVKPAVARAAVAAGATIVNDVSGMTADLGMASTVAELDVAVVIGHRRGTPQTMQSLANYRDVVAEVADELAERVVAALRAGIRRDRILLDPGLGFAKRTEHNVALMRRLHELRSLGFPIVVGPSRKSFLGEILGGRLVQDRDDATTACVALLVAAGAKVVRVHEVKPSLDALKVAFAVRMSSASTP